MSHLKKLSLMGLFALSLLSFNVAAKIEQTPQDTHKSKLKLIGITQIVGHRSLDEVRKGVMDELAANGFEDRKNVRITFSNAQGSVVIASQIAQQFVALKPQVIIAIATPSAQAMINAAKNTTIPIVFAAVTDPIGAKLVKNLEHPGENVTGTMSIAPMDDQIEFVTKLYPDIKTLGILLNYAEANSVNLLKLAEDSARKNNIKIVTRAAANSAEVKPSILSIINKVDGIFLLQDNTIASALPIVLNTALRYKKPVFSAYLAAVESGALAGLAIDDYKIGRQTGKIAVRILKGEKPADIAVESPKDMESAINLNTAKALDFQISDSELKDFENIYPKSN